MLTVSITVNGKPVYARSAHRRTSKWAKGKESAYLLDSGEMVYHEYEKGIIPLAIKMLETIKEV